MNDRRIKQIVKRAISNSIKRNDMGFTDEEEGYVTKLDDALGQITPLLRGLELAAKQKGDEDQARSWLKFSIEMSNMIDEFNTLAGY